MRALAQPVGIVSLGSAARSTRSRQLWAPAGRCPIPAEHARQGTRYTDQAARWPAALAGVSRGLRTEPAQHAEELFAAIGRQSLPRPGVGGAALMT